MFSLPHKTKYSPSTNLAVTGMFVSASFALMESITTVYIDSFLGDASLVGLITAGFTLLAFISFLFTGPILERQNEKTLLYWALAGLILGRVLYSMSVTLTMFLAIAFVVTIIQTIYLQAFSVLLRDNSDDEKVAENMGLAYSLRNVGWLVGPIAGGMIVAKTNFPTAFLIAAALATVAIFHLRLVRTQTIEHEIEVATTNHIILHAKQFFKKPEYRKVYLMNMGVAFWWAAIFIYVPLYMIRAGMQVDAVGLFLGLVAIPLVLLEHRVGALVVKIGHKPFLTTGYLILALGGLVAFLSPWLYLTLAALIIASVGASMLEGTRESYYYAAVPQKDEEKYLGTFMTGSYVASTACKLLMAGVLVVLPFKFVYAVLAATMLIISGLATKVNY